ncbi:MAG TPA: tetratricopeptide repeat protein, partial [Alphaproteobacteria bacterium]|nr:tetratricopeptide repeat protein [Alphaproteobacteria bacterium]
MARARSTSRSSVVGPPAGSNRRRRRAPTQGGALAAHGGSVTRWRRAHRRRRSRSRASRPGVRLPGQDGFRSRSGSRATRWIRRRARRSSGSGVRSPDRVARWTSRGPMASRCDVRRRFRARRHDKLWCRPSADGSDVVFGGIMTRTGARAIAGVGLLACLLATGPALAELVRPLPRTLGPGHGVAVDPAQRAAARALGRAVSALDAGDLEAAGEALEAAADAGPIADHVALQRARWLLARGEPGAAAELARETAAAYPESSLQGRLARLRGDALAAAGEEAEARAAWTSALAHTDAAAERRAIKLAILASRQRTGDLAATEDPERLLASEFPDAVEPGELVAGKRTAEMAMRAGDELVSQGRGADAVEAYREAIAGGLEDEALRDARLREGIALFGLRRYDEALRAFELLGRDPEARFWRARTLARLGRVERAVVGFEALVGTESGDLASRSAYLAATLLEDRGQRARAMALYRRVAAEAADPDLALDALWRIGWSAWKRGDDAEARRRFAEMAARSGDAVDALRPRYWE